MWAGDAERGRATTPGCCINQRRMTCPGVRSFRSAMARTTGLVITLPCPSGL